MNGSGGGPCGACKFLRRKCVKGCIFAPYFDSDQGTTHFAAVHKVFGASNASKMLLRTPPHERLDAVVTLCYEALARVKDPVFGCVGHIFTLQQQVVNLQAELAYIQARMSIFHRVPPRPPSPPPQPPSLSSSNVQSSSGFVCSSNIMTRFENSQSEETSTEIVSFCNAVDEEQEGGDLQLLYVSRCLNGVKFGPSTSH